MPSIAESHKALGERYRKVLGLDVQDWGGAALPDDLPKHPPHAVRSPFAANTKYFAPPTRELVINFAIDDLDAMLARIESNGVAVLGRDDGDPQRLNRIRTGRRSNCGRRGGLRFGLWRNVAGIAGTRAMTGHLR